MVWFSTKVIKKKIKLTSYINVCLVYLVNLLIALVNSYININIIIFVITMIETLAYSTRISGARVKLIATALSLFSTLVIVSRFSTMIQQPLTAKLIAEAPDGNKLTYIEEQYRILIGVTTIGVLVGILLFPNLSISFQEQ